MRCHSTTKPLQMSQKTRPLQCPRRMFLSALMLGWKFTQEKAYETRTWASLSGLSTRELNGNEAVFLAMIDWRLYIAQAVFKRWDIEVVYHVRNPGPGLVFFDSIFLKPFGEEFVVIG